MLAIEALICFTPLGSVPLAPPLIVATLGMIPVVITAILLGTAAGSLMGFFAGLFSFIVWTFMPPSIMAFVFTPLAPPIGDVHGNGFSLLICFAPRILVGTVTGVLCSVFSKMFKEEGKSRTLIYGLGAFVIAVSITVVVFIIGYLIFGILLRMEVNSALVWALLIAITAALTAVFWYLLNNRISPGNAGDFVTFGVSALAGSMVNTILVLGGIYLLFGHSYAEVMDLSYDALIGILAMIVITNGIPEAVLAAACAVCIGKALIKLRKMV